MSTKIEWADSTWNLVTGCTPISESCEHCYAKRMANRLRGRYGYPADDPFRVTVHEDKAGLPERWRRPRMIFVCSMGDLFHQDVPFSIPLHVFSCAARCPHHRFLILTKRPLRMLEFTDWMAGLGHHRGTVEWPQNCWLGVTAENQKRADERIPVLLQIPAALRFVSVEPMLGPVDLSSFLFCFNCNENPSDYGKGVVENLYNNAMGGKPWSTCWNCVRDGFPKIDWVICGGETGPGARPMQKEWVRDLRDQCGDAGVPFFFKKWGPSGPSGNREVDGKIWEQWPEEKPL